MLVKFEDMLKLCRRIQQLLVFGGIDARFVAGMIGMVFLEFASSEAMKREFMDLCRVTSRQRAEGARSGLFHERLANANVLSDHS
jgi:hypothetical protein